jgi:CRISPR-associated protein Cas2
MSRYAVCYDIAHDGRRGQVARILLPYGHRLQRSVFELWLDPEDLPELRRRVGPLLAKTDHFDIFPIDSRRPEARISWQRSAYASGVIFAGPFPPFDDQGESESTESLPLKDESPEGYDAATPENS